MSKKRDSAYFRSIVAILREDGRNAKISYADLANELAKYSDFPARNTTSLWRMAKGKSKKVEPPVRIWKAFHEICGVPRNIPEGFFSIHYMMTAIQCADMSISDVDAFLHITKDLINGMVESAEDGVPLAAAQFLAGHAAIFEANMIAGFDPESPEHCEELKSKEKICWLIAEDKLLDAIYNYKIAQNLEISDLFDAWFISTSILDVHLAAARQGASLEDRIQTIKDFDSRGFIDLAVRFIMAAHRADHGWNLFEMMCLLGKDRAIGWLHRVVKMEPGIIPQLRGTRHQKPPWFDDSLLEEPGVKDAISTFLEQNSNIMTVVTNRQEGVVK